MGRGSGVVGQIASCERIVEEWGKGKAGAYGNRISFCKKRLNFLRRCTDSWSIAEFGRVKSDYLSLPKQENRHWRQRAKELWFTGGDLNTHYFHNAVTNCRRRNRLEKLKQERGICDYFTNIFFSSAQALDDFNFSFVDRRLEERHNDALAALLRPITSEKVQAALFAICPDKSPVRMG
ncbi:unnamed protein product [Cuscuta europaea]|uniref:Uncharacterized protein n=1 Tax=Cuscuta europaea TaxID=41803 RepID=A0A9P0YGE1_CUSEU|nr:unnamed protein product [Cuscuta europaea]